MNSENMSLMRDCFDECSDASHSAGISFHVLGYCISMLHETLFYVARNNDIGINQKDKLRKDLLTIKNILELIKINIGNVSYYLDLKAEEIERSIIDE